MRRRRCSLMPRPTGTTWMRAVLALTVAGALATAAEAPEARAQTADDVTSERTPVLDLSSLLGGTGLEPVTSRV